MHLQLNNNKNVIRSQSFGPLRPIINSKYLHFQGSKNLDDCVGQPLVVVGGKKYFKTT